MNKPSLQFGQVRGSKGTLLWNQKKMVREQKKMVREQKNLSTVGNK